MNTPDTKAAPTGHAGSPRIAAVFAEKARQGRAALIPYVTAGFPEPEQALAVLRALVAGGGDGAAHDAGIYEIPGRAGTRGRATHHPRPPGRNRRPRPC